MTSELSTTTDCSLGQSACSQHSFQLIGTATFETCEFYMESPYQSISRLYGCLTHTLHHNYNHVLFKERMPTLENRRRVADLLLLFRILNNVTDDLPLLQLVNPNACSRFVCSHSSFRVDFFRNDPKFCNPITRTYNRAKDIADNAYFFSGLVNMFKKSVVASGF